MNTSATTSLPEAFRLLKTHPCMTITSHLCFNVTVRPCDYDQWTKHYKYEMQEIVGLPKSVS